MMRYYKDIYPVLGPDSISRLVSLDLSNGPVFESEAGMEEFILSRIEQARIKSESESVIPFGGYFEKRSIYQTSKHFGIENIRNIHMGIDLWVDAGTPLYAAANGIIHSFAYNGNYLDYGYTLIVFYPGLGYVLYGHLSNPTGEFNWKEGICIRQGEKISTVGNKNENGGWIPHLHLQFINQIENYSGDFPGVCSKKDMDYYSRICPDPIFLIRGI
jgi:murein DD-endopeptidase MepM/ murein hydrolase activator NlpD